MQRGSPLYYKELEKELTKRIRGIKDDQFETMISCFLGERADTSLEIFSEKFMKLILQVI